MDDSFSWHQPVQLRFGTGAASAVARELGEDGAVLLTLEGPAGHRLGHAFAEALGSRLLALIQVRPGLASLAQGRALAAAVWPLLRARPKAVLLGVGGGSVMDLAKLLRCRPLDQDFDALQQAVRGQASWPEQQIHRLWLVPTTSGTGSELTRWATLWDTEATVWTKRSLDEPFGWAERAFVDPDLTVGCPPAVMRDCALDAFSHALESLWNRRRSPLSAALAVRAARRLRDALPQAWRGPLTPALRQALSLGALEAGLAFSQTRTALAHALSYAVTLEQGLSHGHAVALWLPAVWRLAQGRDPALDTLLCAVFDTATAEDGARALDEWLASLAVSADPHRCGIADAEARIVQALGSERGRNFVGSPDARHGLQDAPVAARAAAKQTAGMA